MKRDKGGILIFALFISSVLLFIGSSLVGACFICSKINTEKLIGARVFYFAEAGIEAAKYRIIKDSGYFTELSQGPVSKKFLINDAKGEIYIFGEGGFKFVILKSKKIIYSIGFLGSDVRSGCRYSFLRINYEIPLKLTNWERL